MRIISIMEWLQNVIYTVEKEKKVKDYWFSRKQKDRSLGGHVTDLTEERNSWKSAHDRKQNCTCSLTFYFQACTKKAMESRVQLKDAEVNENENDVDNF